MNNNQNYYVFLDIDGTLWDYDHKLKNNTGLLKPESMTALNFLLNKLQEKYAVKIVMTSRKRQHFEKACKLLYDSGLDTQFNDIDKTPWEEGDRAGKILSYMYNQGIKVVYNKSKLEMKLAKLLKKDIFDKYVVLDDEIRKDNKFIPEDKLITPNLYTGSLNKYHVLRFLEREGLSSAEQEGGY